MGYAFASTARFQTDLHEARARNLSETSDSDQAITEWGHVIRLNPESPAAYTRRSAVYLRMGDFDKAQRDFEFVLKDFEVE